MSRLMRILAVSTGVVMLLVLGSGVMVAGTVARSGLVTVSIQEKGPDGLNLFIPVPAGLIEMTLSLAPVVLSVVDHDVLDRELERVRDDLEALWPAIAAVLEAIDDMPDATLVEVEGPHEYVLVTKERGKIKVVVEEDDTRISISVPTRVLRAVGGFLAG